MPRALPALAACAALLAAFPAQGRDLADGGAVALRTSLKSSLLVSRFPDDPLLYPDPVGADAFFRLRLDLIAKPSEDLTAEVAWETRLRATAPPAAAADFLPAGAPPPFRLRPIDEPLATAEGLLWVHELDRAFVAWRTRRAELTVGRQAIGWGRGVLFGAIDLFAPFAALEADRAWRRGVDAARVDVRLGERLSIDAAAALGHDADPDGSVFAARIRGYAGEVDGELLIGRRGQDLVAGVASSMVLGDAEGHAEVALFRTPQPSPDPLLDDDHLVAKAVVGGSYRLPVGQGIPLYVEYHYSGFGAARPGALPALMANPDFTSRLVRGDSQITGRHAVAVLGSYEANEEATFQLLWLTSPRDGSGVLSPSATLAIGDRAAVQATLYLPHGAVPRGGIPQSDFGATPVAALLQLALYD